MRSQSSKNILLVVLILLLILQVTKIHTVNTRGRPESLVKLLHIQTERTGSCWFSTLEYSYQVPQCEQLPVGFIGMVTSSVASSSDSTYFSQKRLLFRSIEPVDGNGYSVKHWWSKLLIVFVTVRVRAVTTLEYYLEEPQAQIVSALLFGGSWRLDQTQQSLFNTIGILHSVAASGLHLSIAVGFVSGLERVLARWQMAVVTTVVSASYLLVAGATPSLLRAFTMVVVGVVARQVWRRPVTPVRVLFVSTSLLLVLFPALSRSVGFQLSVGATAGIMLFSLPLMQNSAFNMLFSGSSKTENLLDLPMHISKVKGYLWDTTVISVGAQLFVLPLLLYHFGSVSLFGIIATSLSGWLIPIIFTVGFSTLAVLAVVPVLFLAVPLFLVLSIFITIIQFGAGFASFLTINQSFSLFQVVASYMLLAVVVLVLHRFRRNYSRYRLVSL